ncbi:MAG: type II secretion system protein [Dokdonella sp.]
MQSKMQGGYSLVEILAAMVIAVLILAGVGVLAARGSTESQALAWTQGVRQVIDSSRDAYKTKDDYTGLSYAVAVANGWVPPALQSATGISGQVPWTGNWSIGPAVGAPIAQPLFLTVTFGAKNTAACVAVTNAMLPVAAEFGNVEKGAWYVPSQGTPAVVVSVCTAAATFTMKYGFAY